MLKLKLVLREAGLRQSALVAVLGWSAPAVSTWLSHGIWPKQADRAAAKAAVLSYLAEQGLDGKGVFQKVAGARGLDANQPSATPGVLSPSGITERDEMLRRKEVLSPAARRKWGFVLDPFMDPQDTAAVYLSAAAREAYEAIVALARAGSGLVAIIGESGAGKTTIKELAIQRLADEVTVIQPYPQGMEQNDAKGKTMKAAHIAEAILRALTPDATPKASSEARFNQVHRALLASGGRHVLIIEEAHCLPTPTLKHLKRFIEMKAGLKSLLAVVLIGQPELSQRMHPKNLEVREVSQRCVDVPLPPLSSVEIEHFLTLRLGRDDVFEPTAYAALHRALQGWDGSGARSFANPLAVQNWAALAMNEAAELHAPKVSAEMIDALVKSKKPN